MEVPGGSDNKLFVCLFEAFGAALLIFVINASQSGAFPPIAIGLALFAGINMFGNVSGAHFNPAVSLAVFIEQGQEKMAKNAGFMLMIWVSQILGCMFGVMMASFVQSGEENIAFLCPPLNSAKLTDSTDSDEGILISEEYDCAPRSSEVGFNMFLAEVIGTFVLAAVIISQKHKLNTAPGTLKAFAVGLTLSLCILMIGGISGACLNPAVGLVQTIFQRQMVVAKHSTSDDGLIAISQLPGFGSLWIYLFAPLLGGIFAGLYSKIDDIARSSEWGKQDSNDDEN